MENPELQAKIDEIANRIKTEEGKQGEIVNINLQITLRGQEAVNYQVIKLFSDTLDHQTLINTLFRLGLRDASQIVKLVALERGIIV